MPDCPQLRRPKDCKPSRCLIALAFLGLIACGPGQPTLSADEASRIVDAARSLESKVESDGCVKKADWPKVISGLKPESVCKRGSGFDIQVWSMFVEAKGYWVAAVGEEVDTRSGTDPQYSWFHDQGTEREVAKVLVKPAHCVS
jgi:hypothetical protein